MTVTDWVQAVSALVIAVLTGMLAFYTRRYVRLTGDMAEVGRQQVELIADERQARGNELFSLVFRLWQDLEALPTKPGMDVRQGQVPSEGDLTLLRHLASSVSRRASSFAAIVDRNASWLRARIEDVRREPGATFDWQSWESHVTKTREALGDLLETMGHGPRE